MNKTDRRQSTRYKAAIPVETEKGEGLIRDFSDSGIFFEADETYSIGQVIEFSFLLKYFVSDRPMRVKCTGETIRVEEKGQKVGVASTISSVTFDNFNMQGVKMLHG